MNSQEQQEPNASINNDSDDSNQRAGGQRRSLRIDRKLLEQLAPGGLMWVPLTSKSQHVAQNQLEAVLNMRMPALFTHHEIYLISRKDGSATASQKVEDSEYAYKKLMDCRYAPLRSVEEQLAGA